MILPSRRQPRRAAAAAAALALTVLVAGSSASADAAFQPTLLPTSTAKRVRTWLKPLAAKGKGGGGMGREELRKALVAEGLEDILASRAVEMADKAVATWEMQVTDFCRPPEVATIQRVLGRVADLAIAADGGFPQAERQRVFFSRALEYEEDPEEARKARAPFFQAVNVEGNFIFDKAGHRDFLGAVLGTGIAREKVGDILLQGERGAHLLLAPEVAEYVATSLAAVRSVPVKNTPIPLAELGVRPPVKKELQSVEASMRLDAVASAGMGMSRSKLKDMVEAGDVLVNWKEVTSANAQLKAGDIVTVRGKGRLEINAVETTSKEKFRVKMTKFV